MNVEFILKLIKPHLKNNKLYETDFEEIFSVLSLREKYSVVEVLIANNIEIIYEEVELNCDQVLDVKRDTSNMLEPDGRNVEHKFITDQININNEQLCLMYQKGDSQALDLLYIKNERFIWKMVNKVGHRYKHKLDDEDLIAYGFFGLRKAAQRFDPSMDNKFVTYAGHWIIQAITRAIADYGFTIRVPVHMFENVNYISRISRDIKFDSETDLVKYISKEKDVDEVKVREWLVVAQNIINPVSLNVPVGEDHDTELVEFLASHEPPTEKKSEDDSLHIELMQSIGCLKTREIEVIKMRFGFDSEQMTLEEVGKHFKVTRERIRQIEAKALRRLASMKNIKELEVYLEVL